MSTGDPAVVRLAELAVERWLGDLGTAESTEFETLRARYPAFDIESHDEVAKTLRVSLADGPEGLPERVGSKLLKGADDYFGPSAMSSGGDAVTDLDRLSTRRGSWFAYGGWLTAAASLLLSVNLWVQRPASVQVPEERAPPAAPAIRQEPAAPPMAASTPDQANKVPDIKTSTIAPVERADAVVERAQFIQTHAWLLQRSFLPGPDPAGETVRGDVVWDANSQSGYMRFRGLRRNDPNVEQYQLWIFDARRDARFPVDGGVFNVSNVSGDEVVQFTARLKVEVPLMFVVTVEHRGGVVVSDRARIAAVAHST